MEKKNICPSYNACDDWHRDHCGECVVHEDLVETVGALARLIEEGTNLSYEEWKRGVKRPSAVCIAEHLAASGVRIGVSEMARYIDADALIKKVFPYDVVDPKCYTINAKTIYEAIKEAPTAEVVPKSEYDAKSGCPYYHKQSEWISVDERLPEDEKAVLCYYGFDRDDGDLGMMFTGVLSYFCFDPDPHWQHASVGLTVTHWMPLPEPPKMKGGAEC